MAGRPGEAEGDRRWPGWGASALAMSAYVAAVGVATWPALGRFASSTPGPTADPFQHLWVIRWSRACLREGRSPFLCPDVQYPVGAPLGLFSPMQLPTWLYSAFRPALGGDVPAYNLIWLCGMLGTGMGAFVLAWYLTRDGASAVFGGLAAMLSTPVMMHAQGHVELIQLGAVPVFLVAWVRFVDRPTFLRMLAAAAVFVLAVASAAYYAVLTPVPAVWYAAWRAYGAVRHGDREWFRARLVPMLGFVAAVIPGLGVLLLPQVWAASHGLMAPRPWSEFEWYGASPWSYIVPTSAHRLGRLLHVRTFESLGDDAVKAYEGASYLGAVPLALMAYAAVRRVKVARGGYWWSVLGVLVVLSMGATLRYGRLRVDLPAGWLWSVFPPFRMIRVPARFNLLAAVVASALAASGMRELLSRLPRGRAALVWCVAIVLTVADLSVSPFMTSKAPEMPAGYAALDRMAPGSAVLDAPMSASGDVEPLSALAAYWQTYRKAGAKTSAGYSGFANLAFDHLMAHGSPFGARELADPRYLADPARQSFGIVHDVAFLDYAWLYLAAHRFDHVVLHHWEGSVQRVPVRLDRLKAVMAGARVFEDAATTIYALDRMTSPAVPVVLCGAGWRSRPGWPGPLARVALPEADLIVYSPGFDRPFVVRLRMSSFREARQVRLLSGHAELARWRVEPGDDRDYVSPPMRLHRGIHHLTLTSDGAARPRSHREAFDARLTPYSLRATSLGVEWAETW